MSAIGGIGQLLFNPIGTICKGIGAFSQGQDPIAAMMGNDDSATGTDGTCDASKTDDSEMMQMMKTNQMMQMMQMMQNGGGSRGGGGMFY